VNVNKREHSFHIMRQLMVSRVDPGTQRRDRAQAGVRTILVTALCLSPSSGSGLVASPHDRTSRREPGGRPAASEHGALLAGTRAVLQNLNSHLEIRFLRRAGYSHRAEAVTAFAERVEALLAAYQREAGGSDYGDAPRGPIRRERGGSRRHEAFQSGQGRRLLPWSDPGPGRRKESIPDFF
jgi:hypothetical protein